MIENSFKGLIEEINPNWKSNSRIFGEVIEKWVAKNMHCSCGGNYSLFAANKKSIDAVCKSCSKNIQIKSSSKPYKPNKNNVLKIIPSDLLKLIKKISPAKPKAIPKILLILIFSSFKKKKAKSKVRIGLIEKDERVLPDMGARVSFLRKVEETENPIKKEGVMVPLNAVGEMDGTTYVLIVSNGKVKINEVEVAEETSNYARITSGLSSGSKVVARFDYELENNQKVTIN